MTKDQESLIDTFATPGWKLLMIEMAEARDHLARTCHMLNTVAELHHRKGSIAQLDSLLAYETVLRNEMIQEADDEAMGL